MDHSIDLTWETLTKVRLKSWGWTDAVERETQGWTHETCLGKRPGGQAENGAQQSEGREMLRAGGGQVLWRCQVRGKERAPRGSGASFGEQVWGGGCSPRQWAAGQIKGGGGGGRHTATTSAFLFHGRMSQTVGC